MNTPGMEELAKALVQGIMAIDHRSWDQGSPDPMEKLLLDLERAPRDLFLPFVENKVDCNQAAVRVVGYMTEMHRRHKSDPLRPALVFLARIPLSGPICERTKLAGVLEPLTASENHRVSALARTLLSKLPTEVKEAPNVLTLKRGAPDGEPDKRARISLSKLKERQRAGPHASPAADSSSGQSPASTQGTPPSVKAPAKAKKRVQWKPDTELVSVRFIETNESLRATSAAHKVDVAEGAAVNLWETPERWDVSESCIDKRLIMFMGVKRGGTKAPAATLEELELEKSLVYMGMRESPLEPADPLEPRGPEPVRLVPFKAIGSQPSPVPVPYLMPISYGVPMNPMNWR